MTFGSMSAGNRSADYPEYTDLIVLAAATAPRFVDPSRVFEPDEISRERGDDWATAIIGRPYYGVRHISHIEAQAIRLAHATGFTVPLPQWLVAERAAAAARREAAEADRLALDLADANAWDDARRGVTVDLAVHLAQRALLRSRAGRYVQLAHVVPATDVTTTRLHRAGRPLCETTKRARPLDLVDEPTTAPATCVRCLEHTRKLRDAT